MYSWPQKEARTLKASDQRVSNKECGRRILSVGPNWDWMISKVSYNSKIVILMQLKYTGDS